MNSKFFIQEIKQKLQSAKLENRRDRIQELMNHLIKMDLIYIKKYISGRKNQKEKTPVYNITMEGKFLSCLLEGRDKK